MQKKATTLFVWATILALLAIIFVGVGFHKITVYENSEYSWGKHVNAYVGGDAYNYIINGTYFAGYSALGGAMLISACLCMVQGIKMQGTNELLEAANEISHVLKVGYSDELEREKQKEAEIERVLAAQSEWEK